MGKKSKKKCSKSSSSSECSYSSSCKTSYVNCTPIYYPNNCVKTNICGNPCIPPTPPLCPPYPCPPQQCVPNCDPKYSTNPVISTIVNGVISTIPTNYTVNIYTTSSITGTYILQLPAILNYNACNYNKQYVISNLNTAGYQPITLTTSGSDTILSSTTPYLIYQGESVILFSTMIGGVGRWIIVK
jgi:hypothetical protein